jgi:hypothetical protein
MFESALNSSDPTPPITVSWVYLVLVRAIILCVVEGGGLFRANKRLYVQSRLLMFIFPFSSFTGVFEEDTTQDVMYDSIAKPVVMSPHSVLF